MTNPYSLLEIKASPIHGRGVFAKFHIPKDRLFVCDVVIVPSKQSILTDYYFPWEGKIKSLCMGFASFLNHSEMPNMKIHSVDKLNLTKTFITLNHIKAGQELTIYYNDKFNDKIQRNNAR